jgi:acyl transferase domain-containing protein/NAD(P)-dependent dehydrogenase (short-subunit alcohol dehydrogenase family)/acyl carrier protein
MNNANLHILKPIWNPIESNQLNSSIGKSNKIFICYDSNTLSKLKSKELQVFFFAIGEHAQKWDAELAALKEFISNTSNITIVNIVNFDNDYTNVTNNINWLQSLIKLNFLIFKLINSLSIQIQYILLKSDLTISASLIEGMALSISKENQRLRFISIIVDRFQIEVSNFFNQLDQLRNSATLFLKYDKSALLEQAFEQIDDMEHYQKSILKNGKFYIITGQGKISKQLARHLIDKYNAKIIIFGRRELDQEEAILLQKIGITSYIKVDLGNIEELKQAWDYCTNEYGSINGIFHLAGSINDKLFQNKDFVDFEKVLYPKVQCTVNLDIVSANTPLDFFISFSSISGVVGNIGQSDYSAANAFLRSWTQYRNYLYQNGNRSGFSICIDWGLWQEGGMKIPFEQSDLQELTSDEAFQAMNMVLINNISSSIIFKGNTEVLAPFKVYNNTKPIKNEPSTITAVANNEDLLYQVIDWIRNTVIKYTKLNNIDNQESIIAKGVDSIATINIITDLEKALRTIDNNIRIIKTIIFDKSSINDLSQYIYNLHHQTLDSLFQNKKGPTPNNKSQEQQVHNKTVKSVNNINGQIKENDIAIIGISGQFPKASTVEEFWNNIQSSQNCIKIIPKDRWDWKQSYDPNLKSEGNTYCRHGGFIESIKKFDPLFFNISPADAEKIDPQERLILQNTYHAIQESCYTPQSLENSGVFISVMYGHYTLYNNDKYVIDSSFASIANRVSYFFNFKGPSLSIDTMCSGGLTALHLACQSIASGDCATAIVGGINLMPHPAKYRLLSQGHFLSPTGKCHSFAKNADGYVPGEGAIVFVLKKLSHAISDGDNILGVIRGSAINSGGRAANYTVPTATAQANVIKKAIERSSVPLESITYIETHGTGTSLGDPIEIQGLTEAYSFNKQNHCALGAVKSNIGHLESAAGLAGVTKVLLQFRHKTIVPTINCEDENPLLELNKTPFYICKKLTKWNTINNYPRRAGVSSFGAGGSNAHVILEEAPNIEKTNIPSFQAYILPISAKSAYSLKANISSYIEFLKDNKNISLYSLSYSAACCREHFRYRFSIIFNSIDELIKKLEQALNTNTWEQYKTTTKSIKEDIVNKQNIVHGHDNHSYNELLYQNQRSYLDGFEVDWANIYKQRSIMKLPLYNFDLKDCWSKEFELSIKNFDQGSNLNIQTHYQNASIQFKEQNDFYGFLPSLEEKPLTTINSETNSLPIIFIDNDKLKNSLYAQYINIEFLDLFSLEDIINKLMINKSLQSQPLKIIFNLQNINVTDFTAYINFFFQTLKFIYAKKLVVNFLIITNKSSDIIFSYHESLKGFFKSISLENENLKVKFVILSPMLKQQDLYTLIEQELNTLPNKFEEIYYQNNIRYIRTYKNILPLQNSSIQSLIKNSGVYIISGGLGKIGQVLSAYLLTNNNANLILLGSSNLDESKNRILNQLKALGGQVVYKKVDITDTYQVQNCVNDIVNEFGVINGVIHAAGRIKDKIFISKEFADFKEIVDIKVQGLISLDKATATLPLDFFVIFSSIASVYGSIGQTDYAMGNSFLDSFSSVRSEWVKNGDRSGLTISINWPLWTEGGMQISSDKMHFIFEQQGILPLSNDDGIQIFTTLTSNVVNNNISQIIPLKGDINIIETSINNAFITSPYDTNSLKDNITSEKLPKIQQQILLFISNIIKMEIDSIDPTITFGEYGFDSVSLQNLSDQIKGNFSLEIPPSAFFTFNSPMKIISYINDKIIELPKNKQSTIAVTDKKVVNTYTPPNKDTIANNNSNSTAISDNNENNINIIGINGIMPGSNSIEGFWHNLKHGINSIQSIKRWNNRDYYGGLIPQMDHFDPKFFGLSAREAMLMDPQHRLFLQVAYNTVIDAGYAPNSLSKVGVFVGVQFNDYQILLQQWKQSRHPYAATGNAHAILANRASYLFNWNGPSQTIDTACSSALIALRRAILALKNNECDYALVGAVSLLIDHEVTDAAKSMGVLSPQYRCATFDESADGYVRGEGVGCVLLKRANDAEKDGDHSYGIIVSSAENHGGRAHSLTAPNPEAQKALLLAAYKDRDLARQVSYIEAHGTGTKLGDPIEIDALKMAWKELGLFDNKSSIGLGSVKTNIGHLEPAAGIASLLKVLLCLKHNTLPANLHFNKLNPYIDIKDSPFYIVNGNKTWDSQGPRVAGISSFGFGGSNAHVVIMEPKERELRHSADKPAYLICISAKNQWSLKQLQKDLVEQLANIINKNEKEYSLANIAYTLNIGRNHFEYRTAWVVSSIDELVNQLKQNELTKVQEVSIKGPVEEAVVPWTEKERYIEQLNRWRELYLQGYEINWDDLHSDESKLRLSLPIYPFHTQPYWFENAADSVMIKEVV